MEGTEVKESHHVLLCNTRSIINQNNEKRDDITAWRFGGQDIAALMKSAKEISKGRKAISELKSHLQAPKPICVFEKPFEKPQVGRAWSYSRFDLKVAIKFLPGWQKLTNFGTGESGFEDAWLQPPSIH